MEISRKVENLKYSLIRVLKEEAEKYPDVIDLTIGEPDIPTPYGIVEEAMEYGKTHQLKYPAAGGGEKIRSLVAEYYNKYYKGDYKAENIIINIGASEALSSCFKTILNPEDEVIIPAPFYPGYLPVVELAYGKPVIMNIAENGFRVTKELLEKYVTPKTKALLFSNPCNPTGNVMSLEEMKEIAEFVAERDIFLISDEIYSALSFYEFHSFAEFKNIKDKTIIINGFSKSHSMTGWRIGYTICPEKYRKNFLNATFYTLSSPIALSIAGAETALEKFSDRTELMNIYKERAEFIAEGLEKIGFKVIKPKGAFYLFADYSNLSELNSFDFAVDVLKKVQVAVVPGTSFGTEKFVRFALTTDLDNLEEAVERLRRYR